MDDVLAQLIDAFEPIGEPPPDADETDVDDEGWIYRVSDGMILGRADADPAFVVDTLAKAEWVLEVRSRIEGQIAGIDARIAAVTKQLRLLRAEQTRRLSWWDWKFGPSLVAFARAWLVGRKGKTFRVGWGSVSFRQTQGSHQILDMEAAVGWVKGWDPSKVKTAERVGVKDVLAVRETVRQLTGEWPDRPGWLAASEGGESVTISTGIEIDVKANDDNETGKAVRS